MNKDFPENKLLSFDEHKQVRVLFDLASFIEKNQLETDSKSFKKLEKYHFFLKDSKSEFIQKISKEFFKVKTRDYQFQVYLMNLERFLGMSSKEYEFIMQRNDKEEKQQQFDLICLCDSIRSAHNIGSFFRNAECFGASKIILTGLSPTPDNPQVQKTSMGCDSLLPWEFHKDAIMIIKQLKEQGYLIIGVETTTDAIELKELKLSSKKIVCLFGHEQFGLSLELLKTCDLVTKIKLFGQKNSLNVAVSQAIFLKYITDQMQYL